VPSARTSYMLPTNNLDNTGGRSRRGKCPSVWMRAEVEAVSNAYMGAPRIGRCQKVLDLLAEPLPEGCGVERAGGTFVVSRPWAVAQLGLVEFKGGWWTFECEGEGDISAIELRLQSPQDALLAYSIRRAAGGATFLHTGRVFEVSLLVSAWPGAVNLSKLRLRRITAREQMTIASQLLVRALRSPSAIYRAAGIASRVIGGRALRLHGMRETPLRARAPELADAAEDFRLVRGSGIAAVVRADEKLHERALEIAATAFEQSPGLRIIYADLDQGGYLEPRPAWDPDLAEACDYVHSPVFFRDAPEVVDPWTALSSEDPACIGRISLPLARRERPARMALAALAVPSLPDPPLVSVIIPTKSRLDLLAICLDGLANRTDYARLEVIIVDNGADKAQLDTLVEAVRRRLPVDVIDRHEPFNFPRLINAGVRHSSGEIVLLLNDDIDALEPDWLKRIVSSAMLPDVGCVGARLLYPDGAVQHAGMMLGLAGYVGHLWKGLSQTEAAIIPQVVMPSGRMAVTGACLAVRRELFDRVGGLDEVTFPVAYNDVDFCLRVRSEGYRTVYRGDAVLVHRESQSRGDDDATMQRRIRVAREASAFAQRWGSLLHDDPFGSPAFDTAVESGAIHPSLRDG
jgi:GT2 family glycosyltransferase